MCIFMVVEPIHSRFTLISGFVPCIVETCGVTWWTCCHCIRLQGWACSCHSFFWLSSFWWSGTELSCLCLNEFTLSLFVWLNGALITDYSRPSFKLFQFSASYGQQLEIKTKLEIKTNFSPHYNLAFPCIGQAVEYTVFNISKSTKAMQGRLPLTPGSQLMWFGFSEEGLLSSYDSKV